MVSVLTVLKIIGIVLACILTLLLAVLLIVLFVPVRYSIKGRYKEDIFAKAYISYLLHLFGVHVRYDDDLRVILRILFIQVKLYPKKKDGSGTDKKRKEDGRKEDKHKEDKSKDEAIGSDDKKDADKEGSPDGHDDRLNRVKAYLKLLNEDSTKEAFEVCRYRLGKLLKAILPGKIRISITYGLDDPYMTAVIMSLYNVFYTYIGEGLTIYPVYYEKTVSAEGIIKGRIMAAPVLWQAVMVLLNRDCRRFFKRFKSIDK